MLTGDSMTRVNPALSIANWFIEMGISVRIAPRHPTAASVSPKCPCMPGNKPPRWDMAPASTIGITSGEAIVARPRGERSARRNWVNATAEAAGERPGMTRSHRPPNEPARRMAWFAGMSRTRRYVTYPARWMPSPAIASPASGSAARAGAGAFFAAS